MERIGEKIVRLAMPYPFFLFYGIPPLSFVNARMHGHLTRVAELYEIDYGERPAGFNVPAGAVPPAASVLRMPQAVVFLSDGGPTAPGPDRDPQYIHQYAWSPFAPAVQGSLVPLGKEQLNFQMPRPTIGSNPDDLPVLRFRWRGSNVQVGFDTTVGGTPGPGPYTLDLSNGGLFPLPIVPGTVRIVAPTAAGVAVSQDWPWPTAQERRYCETGRMIGSVDPLVNSTINYETGQVVVTFDQPIVAAPPNILADFESGYGKEPMDIRVTFDVNMA